MVNINIVIRNLFDKSEILRSKLNPEYVNSILSILLL